MDAKTHTCPDCGHSCLSDAPKQALTDLNQRLIDRTSGMIEVIQAQQLESDSIVGSCDCLTKTPEVKHHKPGCKYRLISERDAAREIIEQAYVHNQNMHCLVTKGRLNDQLNEQTHLLRKFLKP